MPITSSAKKAARQAETRRLRRLPQKTRMKTSIRAVKDLVSQGKHSEALTLVAAAYKAIDMASKKNIIHWKNAARKKSAIARLVALKK